MADYLLIAHLVCFCWMADLDQFQLGTLSHMINVKANGYQELPDWPEVPPDPSVRDVDVDMAWTTSLTAKSKLAKKKSEREKSFFSEDESSSSGGWFCFLCRFICIYVGVVVVTGWVCIGYDLCQELVVLCLLYCLTLLHKEQFIIY